MNEAAPASDPALMTAEEALAAAEAEGLTLLLADNATGFACVARLTPKGRAKPYKADVWEEGKIRNLGTFATGEGAALAVARSLGPEGVAAKINAHVSDAPEHLKVARIAVMTGSCILILSDAALKGELNYYHMLPHVVMAGVVCVVVERVLDRENRALDDLPRALGGFASAGCENMRGLWKSVCELATAGFARLHVGTPTMDMFKPQLRAKGLDDQQITNVVDTLRLLSDTLEPPVYAEMQTKLLHAPPETLLPAAGALLLILRPTLDRSRGTPDASAAPQARAQAVVVDMIEKLLNARRVAQPEITESRASPPPAAGDMSPRAVTQANLDVTFESTSGVY